MEIVSILHSLIRWAVLLFGLWTLLNAITGISGKRSFNATDKRTNLLFMVSCDIQLLVGIILYLKNGWFERLSDMGNNMKDPYNRFFTIEHMSMMILAWVLVHIGNSSVKKAASDTSKYKKILIFSGLAIVLILASIPWPFRELIGKPWLRWFN